MAIILIQEKKKPLKNPSNTEVVKVVYDNHHNWLLQVGFNFCQDKDRAEDLVQELYIYLLEMKDIGKIRYNNTVNLFYLYKALKSKFLNQIKQNNKITVLPVEEDYLNIQDSEYDEDKDKEFEHMLETTKHLLDTEIHWYDSRLLMTYINEKHSIASLHKATGISKSSIWTSLTKTKGYIKNSYDNKVTPQHETSSSKN